MSGRGSWTRRLTALVVAACAFAWPGAAAALDLGPLADLAAARAQASEDDAAARRAWELVARKLGRAERGLAGHLAALSFVSRRAAAIAPGDAELAGLVTDALAVADTELAAEPGATSFHVAQIKLQRGRDRVLAVVARASDLHVEGVAARGRGDTAGEMAFFVKSARTFARAVKLAKALIAKQGGGIGQF